MKKLIFCCLLLTCLLFLIAPISRGQTEEREKNLTLTQAVKKTLAQFPSIRVSLAKSEEAEAFLGKTMASRYPDLKFQASATRYEEPMVVTPIHGFTPGFSPPFDKTLVQSGLELNYILFDGGARSGRIKQALSQFNSTKANISVTRQTLIAQVVSTFLGVLSQRQILQAHALRLKALQSEVVRIKKRFDVGKTAEVEILRVEASLANAEADRVRDAEALNRSERDLARLMGVTSDEVHSMGLVPVVLRETFLPLRDRLISQAMELNPRIELERKNVSGAVAALRIANSTWWPDFNLFGNYKSFGSGEGDFTEEWQAGLKLSYSLFTGGAQQMEISRARAVIRSARESLFLLKLQIEGEIDRAISAVEEAHARVKSLETAVDRFTEVARIEQLLLEAGRGTQTDFLSAEADLLNTRADLVQAIHGKMVAYVELARITGKLDLPWLEETLDSQK